MNVKILTVEKEYVKTLLEATVVFAMKDSSMLCMIKVLFVVSIMNLSQNTIVNLFQGNYSTLQYRVEEDNGCSISSINETSLIYETPNPYSNSNRCKAEFYCPGDQTIRYFIQRFDIEEYDADAWNDYYGWDDCAFDSLGMYNLNMIKF